MTSTDHRPLLTDTLTLELRGVDLAIIIQGLQDVPGGPPLLRQARGELLTRLRRIASPEASARAANDG